MFRGVGANKVYWGRFENCEQANFDILEFILAANKANYGCENVAMKIILSPFKVIASF